MRIDSLSFRLFLSAALWSAVSLVAAGIILVALYTQSVERAFDARLSVYLKTLVGALAEGVAGGEDPSGLLPDPGNLGEPRFVLPFSGWYWMVQRDRDRVVVAGSASLAGDSLSVPNDADPAFGRATGGFLLGPRDERLRYLSRVITFPDGATYLVTVAGSIAETETDIRVFGRRVALTLAVFGLGLVLATFIQVRIGLKPLDRMRTALQAVRTGAATRLEGHYPTEIEPLAQELNALIDANHTVIERARTHVGNLAHGLKTPLSVILNEARASRGPFADLVIEQARRMEVQISHHLDRARIAGRRRPIGARTEVAPVVAGIARVLRRLQGSGGIAISVDVPEGLSFRGERQDLEEMVGNLMENGCKWARTRILVTARLVEEDRVSRIRIDIDDDGQGLSEAERRQAVLRGERLDESTPGSGLGLSIVTDVSALYRGQLELLASPLGGLRARLVLPSV